MRIKRSKTKLECIFIKLEDYAYYYCSNCNEVFDTECSPPYCAYCPECGAKNIDDRKETKHERD